MGERLTLDQVTSVIEGQGIVVDREISEETRFADLDVDSLDRVELQFALEERLGVDLDIDDKVLDQVQTVADLIRVVNASLDGAR